MAFHISARLCYLEWGIKTGIIKTNNQLANLIPIRHLHYSALCHWPFPYRSVDMRGLSAPTRMATRCYKWPIVLPFPASWEVLRTSDVESRHDDENEGEKTRVMCNAKAPEVLGHFAERQIRVYICSSSSNNTTKKDKWIEKNKSLSMPNGKKNVRYNWKYNCCQD